MTDADFFYPTAGDSERQPKKRFLIVEGTGASTATRTIRSTVPSHLPNRTAPLEGLPASDQPGVDHHYC